MDERQEMLEHLTERVGFTPEEAERAMRDDDLWVSLPGQRRRSSLGAIMRGQGPRRAKED